MFCSAELCVLSIISLGNRELVVLLVLSSWLCVAVIVLCLILSVPWVDLQYMIVAFPGHTHFLSRSEIMKHFFMLNSNKHGISTAFKN